MRDVCHWCTNAFARLLAMVLFEKSKASSPKNLEIRGKTEEINSFFVQGAPGKSGTKFCWKLTRKTEIFEEENKTAGLHRHIFRPTTNILINFCKRLKTTNYCFDISFQRVFTNINSTTDFCFLCKRVSRFSVEKFSSHSAKKFRRGTLLCFWKIQGSKNFKPKRGISRFSVENLLSHSAENFGRGTFLCCVSENFW